MRCFALGVFLGLMLQQHLPLAVLKHKEAERIVAAAIELQQHLPLAVLKLKEYKETGNPKTVATALTACGIETFLNKVSRY